MGFGLDVTDLSLDLTDLGLVSGDPPSLSAAVRLLPEFWNKKNVFYDKKYLGESLSKVPLFWRVFYLRYPLTCLCLGCFLWIYYR